MGLNNYIVQKDLYELLQADTSDLMMSFGNGEFHIIFIDSPTSKVFYPYKTKVGMEEDYLSLLGIINKLKF